MTNKLLEAAAHALETLEKFVSKELTFGQRYTNEGEEMLASICKLRAALVEQQGSVGPFEYWNAVEGWVMVEPDEIVDGRAKQKMRQAALKTVDPQYKDDPEVMFALGWEAGFNARYRERP
jgi:hypothetical protein